MRDIFLYTSYSFMPTALMMFFQTFASMVMSVDESSIFSFLGFLGTFWTGLLLYTGTMTTHQYGAIATFLIILVLLPFAAAGKRGIHYLQRGNHALLML